MDRYRPRAAGRPHGARRFASLLLSGLLLGLPPGAAVVAQGATSALQSEAGPYAGFIAEAARRFAIPEPWIRAVMGVESAGDPRAVSSAGAMGLMQVMPNTWDELRLRHRLGPDPFAPRDNILAGVAYLREMFTRYGNTAAMLAAYNAGPERYDEYLADGRALPAETRAYVAKLAPLLDGSVLPETAAQPSDWREADIFVGDSDAGETQTGRTPDGTPPAPPAGADGLAPAPTGGIFVARSGAGGAQ
ncbi:hypothetical protein BFN67_12440 [Pseudaminobacter manganicus]|uniref:Transglycosylase SLT domain-containing protein n=2 Tax=Manganibacter manganicus TaxID=1873176 RepID=A0A1V8RU76_9HYPH|nr:hypothetical protein BFN67_12440 [Pseudaminobacter manganicus]